MIYFEQQIFQRTAFSDCQKKHTQISAYAQVYASGLADLTGLTHGYVRDLECLTIDKTPLLETIGKFADALEIDIRQLFDDIN